MRLLRPLEHILIADGIRRKRTTEQLVAALGLVIGLSLFLQRPGNTTAMTKEKSATVALTGLSLTAAQGAVNATSFEPMQGGHPCYTLVGQIAAESARIERLLDNSIAAVAGLDHPISACITSQLSGTNPRFDALRKLLAWQGFNDFEVRLKKLKKSTGEDMVPRNAAVHDPWLIDSFSGEPHQQLGMRKPLTYGVVPRSVGELENTLAKLKKRRESVTELLNEIWLQTKS